MYGSSRGDTILPLILHKNLFPNLIGDFFMYFGLKLCLLRYSSFIFSVDFCLIWLLALPLTLMWRFSKSINNINIQTYQRFPFPLTGWNFVEVKRLTRLWYEKDQDSHSQNIEHFPTEVDLTQSTFISENSKYCCKWRVKARVYM